MKQYNNRFTSWREIDAAFDRMAELKKQTITAEEGKICYPSLCGYYQAIIPVLARAEPEEALTWLREIADYLEQELPFVILKNSKH
jgi:hypothetical protein